MPNEDGALQPHELAGGESVPVFGTPPLDAAKGVNIMAIEMPRKSGPGTWTAEEDVTETLPDGRTIQVATKGAEIPMAEAEKLGLVKAAPPPGPAETKEEAPAETKTVAEPKAKK